MGLHRIFAYAVLGTLIPTVILGYLLMRPAHGASAEIKACEAAQGFVRAELGDDKKMSFLACDQSKEMKLSGGRWQVLGDVEIETPAGPVTHQAYVVQLELADDGSPARLESLSLR